jgi:hypothetical protein
LRRLQGGATFPVSVKKTALLQWVVVPCIRYLCNILLRLLVSEGFSIKSCGEVLTGAEIRDNAARRSD